MDVKTALMAFSIAPEDDIRIDRSDFVLSKFVLPLRVEHRLVQIAAREGHLLSDNKIISLKKRRELDRETSLYLVRKCRDRLSALIPHLIRELFEHADDDMFRLADKSERDIVETQYFAAMRQLRKLRESVERSFVDYIQGAFNEFWTTHNLLKYRVEERRSGNLSLVKDDELEEQLAIDGMASKAESRFSLELLGLGARFSKIAHIEKLDAKDNPIGPHQIVEGFRHAMAHWDGDIALRLVVFKIFDRQVVAYLGGIYDELNALLIEHGVLPKIRCRVRKNPVAPSILRAQREDPSGANRSYSADTEGAVALNEVVDVIARLLVTRRRITNYVPDSSNLPQDDGACDRPSVRVGDLIDALSRLQTNILNNPISTVGDVQERNTEYIVCLGKLLDIGPHETATHRIAKSDRLLIDVVGMFFDYLLEQNELPDCINVLIARLQFPVIKAARIDVSFFSNKNHPARRLLNTIARAVSGWTDDGDRSERSVYGQIDLAVSRVLKEFRDDLKVFDEVDGCLTHYLERQSRGAQKTEHKLKQLIRGQEQLLTARRRATQSIQDINKLHSKLPSTVLKFEREAWQDFLLLTYLRDGKDGKDWSEACATLKLLVWSVTPKDNVQDRQKLLKVVQALLRRLRAGLKYIAFNAKRQAEFFAELKKCHRAALQGRLYDSELANSLDDTVAARSEAKGEVVSQHVEESRRPRVGQWLQWEKDGISYRGKLAWRSRFDGRCVFVNHKGLRLAEMSGQDLTALIIEANAKIVEPGTRPLVDEVLDSMTAAANNQLADSRPR